MTVACSCGDPDCRELGWPHEWDCSDDGCVLCGSSVASLLVDGRITAIGEPLSPRTAIRYGSGYAHPECVEGQ